MFDNEAGDLININPWELLFSTGSTVKERDLQVITVNKCNYNIKSEASHTTFNLTPQGSMSKVEAPPYSTFVLKNVPGHQVPIPVKLNKNSLVILDNSSFFCNPLIIDDSSRIILWEGSSISFSYQDRIYSITEKLGSTSNLGKNLKIALNIVSHTMLENKNSVVSTDQFKSFVIYDRLHDDNIIIDRTNYSPFYDILPRIKPVKKFIENFVFHYTGEHIKEYITSHFFQLSRICYNPKTSGFARIGPDLNENIFSFLKLSDINLEEYNVSLSGDFESQHLSDSGLTHSSCLIL
ncbi:MAG: hypothetical protein H6911_01540 [Rickettsiaceae bacterium]|nr:hypothetical protein [Rickettsiaceae bacterium]